MKHFVKRTVLLLLAGAMVLSLAGCFGAPSEEKIIQALDDGTITVEDAKAKGWIDDDWIDDHFKSVEASTKIHQFDVFETTYLNGEEVSSSIISEEMCLVFFDTAKDGTLEKLEVFNQIADIMRETGVPVLGIVMDEELAIAQETLKYIKFPVIVYNDAMKSSLGKYEDILDDALTFVFTKDGGFYTAWNTNVDKEKILEVADWIAKGK